MIVNVKTINVVDYFNNSYDKLYPTDTSKHFSAIISTCTQKLFDMETAQLHCIQKNVINPLVKIISTSFNLDIAKF